MSPAAAPVTLGLPDARLRLAYINQYRELVLGGMLALAAAARLLGAPISARIVVLLALWFALALAFVRVTRATRAESSLHRTEFLYLSLELALVTLLAHYTGAAEWLALLFFLVTVLFANMVLPRRPAFGISALAASSFFLLVKLDSPAPGFRSLFLHRSAPHANFLAATLFVGAVGAYALIGLTLAQFSHMLRGQALALQSSNHDLAVAGLELRLHRDNLEILVQSRTGDLVRTSQQLIQANQELRRLNDLKSNFLANVSHELRTPLTSIRSFSEILLNYPEEDVFTRCEFLEIIIAESDRLTRLINDVLDLAKIEAGKMEWKIAPLQWSQIVRDSLGLIQVVAAQKGLRLVNRVPAELPLVLADPDRLRQVLTNLLSNALKFTTNGHIEVGHLQRPGEVVIFVADTGYGILPEDLDRIFEKFHQQGNALTDKPAGTGLGLSICHEIMHHLGGSIWVESEPGRGSIFYCALPIHLPAASTATV